MKGMKEKLLKTLKSIHPTAYTKQDRVIRVSAADGYIENRPKSFDLNAETVQQKQIDEVSLIKQEAEVIDVSELMRDLEDEDSDFDEDKENILPPVKAKESILLVPELQQSTKPSKFNQKPLSEIDISSFRRPELNSGSLFDPNLLQAFQQAIVENRKCIIQEENKGGAAADNDDDDEPLLAFEEKCPPGGNESVILYTTSLQGIRKTFEDCNNTQFLLESFGITFQARDVSMHSKFKEELWQILGEKVTLPRLFIKGRYIGGVNEILRLNEKGKLLNLLNGVPIAKFSGCCEGCAGFRFVVCFNCNGSNKIVGDDGLDECHECNENGLIMCPICC